jgi:hypothetical protein
VIVISGISIAAFDPPGGTSSLGTFTIHYPTALFRPMFAGWLDHTLGGWNALGTARRAGMMPSRIVWVA